MDNFAVEVSGLRVIRGGKPVLPGLDFTIDTGTVTGLVGPSGCGKTTLLRCVVGVQVVRAGTVTVLGQPAGSAALRHRIGYSTQSPAVYGDLTVRENLKYFAAVKGTPAEHVDEVVEEVGLSKQIGQVALSLSGGQLARVSLAVALLGEPELLILDEPTVGLDPVLRDELWGLFHRLVDRGRTMMISSHVMDEAARCDRLLLMRDGGLLAHDTPDALRDRTGTEDLEQAFLRLVREQKEEVASS
jgi:ABC-2 type transport system ATP-binding protein